MATLMKVMVGLLLLACVCTVCGGDKGARKKDVCTQGMVAVEVFLESRGCRNLSRTMRELMRSLRHNVTVDTLRQMFTNYCGTLMPRFRQCFEGNIQNCSADQQSSLMAMAQESGFLCQPSTTTISPQFEYILTQLSDNDLAVGPSCFNYDRREYEEICHNRTLTAMGLPRRGFRLLENFTMEEVAPQIQVLVTTMTECLVTQVRDNPNRCDQWRGVALRAADLILWPFLGSKMTFTNEDIDRMFEWNSPARRDDTGGLDDFMQLSEDWP